MKKLFQVSKGDVLFSISGREIPVKAVRHYQLEDKSVSEFHLQNHYDRWQSIENPSRTSGNFCMSGGYLTHEILYTTKFEALSQRKNGLMNELNRLKSEALKAVKAVKNYREKHFEELNLELTDPELNKLKKEI